MSTTHAEQAGSSCTAEPASSVVAPVTGERGRKDPERSCGRARSGSRAVHDPLTTGAALAVADRRRNHGPTRRVPHLMIRTATPADLDAIVQLHTEARSTYYRGHIPEEEYAGAAEVGRSRGGWSRAIDRPDTTVFCAERDGALAGIAAYAVRDGVMHLTQLHVSPSHWRRGIGTELHSACVDAWRQAGVDSARLEVFVHNTRAQSFYADRGWAPDPGHPRTGAHLVLRLMVS